MRTGAVITKAAPNAGNANVLRRNKRVVPHAVCRNWKGKAMKRTLAVLAILALSACSAIATKDIDQAIGLAQTANDTQGLACLKAQRLIFGAEPIGVFTVMEQARLMQNAMSVCAGVLANVTAVPGSPLTPK